MSAPIPAAFARLAFEGEIWRPIPGLPGCFASDAGRVCREPYVVDMPMGGKRVRETPPTYGSAGADGRHRSRLLGKTRTVSVMVCMAFHGERPFPDAHCMHMDENCRNDRADNLQWGTRQENFRAPLLLERRRQRRGDRHPNSILSEEAVRAIRSARGTGSVANDLAAQYGVCPAYVRQIWCGAARAGG